MFLLSSPIWNIGKNARGSERLPAPDVASGRACLRLIQDGDDRLSARADVPPSPAIFYSILVKLDVGNDLLHTLHMFPQGEHVMSMGEQAQIAPVAVASDLTLSDLRAALAAGWSDFRAYPTFGLFFAAIYVIAGMLLYFGLFVRGEIVWLVAAAAGFPLLAPFVAVGLYEVSRRREAGMAMSWRAALGALRGRGDEQILTMGVILFVAFGFWLGLAHGIFAIFLGASGIGSESLGLFSTGAGIMMLLVGGVAGALMALAFYAITVVSLPMLVDRQIDFISAIIVSLASVRSNKFVLLTWAVLIATALFVAMLPLFLGLLVVLPVLGHATWHLYRRLAGKYGVAAPV